MAPFGKKMFLMSGSMRFLPSKNKISIIALQSSDNGVAIKRVFFACSRSMTFWYKPPDLRKNAIAEGESVGTLAVPGRGGKRLCCDVRLEVGIDGWHLACSLSQDASRHQDHDMFSSKSL